jgi:HEPN domain-containing protein
MNATSDRAVEVRQWVEKAEHDLRNAQYVLTLTDNCPADTVCFHCHQCAEKYLKALLVAHGIVFPKTHDLVVLFNLSTGYIASKLSLSTVQPLNRYAVEARYPGDWEPINRQEAAAAVRMAGAVREVVRSLLPVNILTEGQ